MSGVTVNAAGSDTQIQYNSSGVFAGSANLTFNGTTLTANTLNLTNALTTAYGGTGLTTFTAGDVPYYASGTALSKLGIGTAGQILTSTGSAPQWSTLSGVAVTTFSAGTTGFTPSSATSGAVTLAGTLATTNGGTGLTSFTANGVVYASSSSALTTGSALTFDGAGLFKVTEGSGNALVQLLTSGSGGQLAFIQTTRSGPLEISSESSSPSISFRLGTSAPTTEQMRLTSTGLGIGTSSPGYKLDVSGTARVSSTSGETALLTATGVSNYLSIKGDTGGTTLWNGIGTDAGIVWVGSVSNHPLVFRQNNTERMRLDTSGNVNIATGGRLSVPSQTGFMAGIASATDATVTVNTVIPFNTVTATGAFNTGTGFNTSTSLFTAPVAGRYLISFTVYLTSSSGVYTQYMQAAIRINGSFQAFTSGDVYGLAVGVPSASGDLLSIGTSVVVNLAANDTVGVAARTNNLRCYTGHTFFSGYLLG